MDHPGKQQILSWPYKKGLNKTRAGPSFLSTLSLPYQCTLLSLIHLHQPPPTHIVETHRGVRKRENFLLRARELLFWSAFFFSRSPLLLRFLDFSLSKTLTFFLIFQTTDQDFHSIFFFYFTFLIFSPLISGVIFGFCFTVHCVFPPNFLFESYQDFILFLSKGFLLSNFQKQDNSDTQNFVF